MLGPLGPPEQQASTKYSVTRPNPATSPAVNRYFVWPPGAHDAAEFQPQVYLSTGRLSDMYYFCRILQALDRALPGAGVTFLVTWNVDRFDDRFEDAIVLLIGDERCQTPSYVDRVRAVFKTGGIRRNPIAWTLMLPWSIAWRVMLRDLRNVCIAARRGTTGSRPSLYAIPLGTYHLVEVPYVPFEARSIDVFFAGTVPKLSRFDLRPSVAARLQLVDGMRAAEAALPDWRFEHRLTRTDGTLYDADEYSWKTANSKIVPCPRGNFEETFRLFEAAKCGCVIVTEPLPRRWYYRDAPVIEIRRWSQLPAALDLLRRHPERILELAEKTKRWWDECLCETAVARYMIDNLGLSSRGNQHLGAQVA